MSEYKRERMLLDSWARWIDACNRAAIRAHWYPAQDTTSRHADLHGERADKRTGKAVESAPIDYAQTEEERRLAYERMTAKHHSDRCEWVDQFMVHVKELYPLRHLCIEARHRRVIGSIRVGKVKGKNGRLRSVREGDLAAACIPGPDPLQVKLGRFERECAAVYAAISRLLDK